MLPCPSSKPDSWGLAPSRASRESGLGETWWWIVVVDCGVQAFRAGSCPQTSAKPTAQTKKKKKKPARLRVRGAAMGNLVSRPQVQNRVKRGSKQRSSIESFTATSARYDAK